MSKRTKEPSTDGKTTGRDEAGKFMNGNRLGRGGAPLAQRSLALRAALLASVTAEDIAAIVKKLIEKARKGDLRAAREILNRTCGKAINADPREPLQVNVLAEAIVAERMESLRRRRIEHARGERLDEPPTDEYGREIEADLPFEHRVVRAELRKRMDDAA
jgi:hypothetical protein